jgi:hypothetical protein
MYCPFGIFISFYIINNNLILEVKFYFRSEIFVAHLTVSMGPIFPTSVCGPSEIRHGPL